MPDSSASSSETLRRGLRRLGYENFLPGQEQAVRQLLAGRDVQVVLPTGAGKSLVYQLAAELLPGLTLVISPLIALMKDQVAAVEAQGRTAARINSHFKPDQIAGQLKLVEDGNSKLLFVTPERFDNAEFSGWLERQTVSLLVVDEAHCISEWGHDFRPAYGRLGQARTRIGRPLTLALTATATPYVLRDITRKLGMRRPEVIIGGIDRPNLFLEARRTRTDKEAGQLFEQLILHGPDGYDDTMTARIGQALQGSGIIYVASVNAARHTAKSLQDWGITADYYHGQRRKADRDRVQDAFMSGRLRVIVATNAFGMGIDKPDIRFVLHRDMPSSLEAYYQEVGRAGRDGGFAYCGLMYSGRGYSRAAFLGSGSSDEAKEYERGRLQMMRRYAEHRGCRRAYILNYFTEPYGKPACGHCDNDLRPDQARGVRGDATLPVKPSVKKHSYSTGQDIEHQVWGKGVVQHVDHETVTALFDGVGSKRFSVAIARRHGQLMD